MHVRSATDGLEPVQRGAARSPRRPCLMENHFAGRIYRELDPCARQQLQFVADAFGDRALPLAGSLVVMWISLSVTELQMVIPPKPDWAAMA